MIVKLLTEQHLEFLSLKGGCRGSSKSTFVKMSNCWKSHAAAQLIFSLEFLLRDIEKTNIADPDQTRQNVASDQGLRGFLLNVLLESE